jgi:hypothetical protein
MRPSKQTTVGIIPQSVDRVQFSSVAVCDGREVEPQGADAQFVGR